MALAVTNGDPNHRPWLMYPDRGCWVSPKCLECPLETCIEDIPFSRKTATRAFRLTSLRAARRARDAEIIRLYLDGRGLSYKAIGQQFGIGDRAIAHIVSREMKGDNGHGH